MNNENIHNSENTQESTASIIDPKLKKKRNSKRWRWFLLLPAAAIIYFVFFRGPSPTTYEFAKSVRKDLVQAVEVTGKIAPGATINLSFLTGGKIQDIRLDTGDKLKKNQVIASLMNRDQSLNVNRSSANLRGAQANLNQKLAGATSEDVRISQANFQQTQAGIRRAQVDLQNAQDNYSLSQLTNEANVKKGELSLQDAQSKLTAAQRGSQNTGNTSNQNIQSAKSDLQTQTLSALNTLQQSFINLKGFVVNDGNSVLGSDFYNLDKVRLNTVQTIYGNVKGPFDSLYAEFIVKQSFTEEELKNFAQQTSDILVKTVQAQKALSDMLSIVPLSITLPAEKLANFKANVLNDSSIASSALNALNLKIQALLNAELNLTSNVDTTISNVENAQNYYDQQVQNLAQVKISQKVDLSDKNARITSAEAALEIAKAEADSAQANLDLKRAKPRQVDIAFLQAQVALAGVDLSLAKENLEKTFLKAPLSGVLTLKLKQVGEDVGLSERVFEMISDEKYKIDVDIAEVDIGKIKVGNKAQITVDALGQDMILRGTVTKIAPKETVVQDVVFYKAEITIDDMNSAIKPGMTAEVQIVLNERKGVLALPEKAVQTDEQNQKYVRILQAQKEVKVPVQVGIINLEGDIEIVSGLQEGQEVILRTTSKK